MKFNAIERVMVLARVLPNKGSVADMASARSLRKKLFLTDKEAAAVCMQEETNDRGMVTSIKDVPAAEKLVVDIEVTENEKALLKKSVARLDKEGDVTESVLDLLVRIRDLP